MVLHGCACVYNCRQVVRGIPARCALLYGVLCLQEPPANCIACVGFHKKCAGLTRAVARFDCALCQVQPAYCLVGWILRMRLYVFMRAPWNRDVCRKVCLRARIRCGCNSMLLFWQRLGGACRVGQNAECVVLDCPAAQERPAQLVCAHCAGRLFVILCYCCRCPQNVPSAGQKVQCAELCMSCLFALE